MSNVITEQESQLNCLLELTVGHMVWTQGEDDTIMFLKDLIGLNRLSRTNENWDEIVEATIEEVKNGDYS